MDDENNGVTRFPPCAGCCPGLPFSIQTKRVNASKGKLGFSPYMVPPPPEPDPDDPDAPLPPAPKPRRFLTEQSNSIDQGVYEPPYQPGNGSRTRSFDWRTGKLTSSTSGNFWDVCGGGMPPPEVTLTETSKTCVIYSYGFSDPDDPDSFGKLGEWARTTHTLTNEYTAAMLLGHVDELLEACDPGELEWGQSRAPVWEEDSEGNVEIVCKPGGGGGGLGLAHYSVAASELSISKSKSIYRIRVRRPDDWFEGIGSVRLRWREATITDPANAGEEPNITFSATRTATFSWNAPPEDPDDEPEEDKYAYSSEFAVNAPSAPNSRVEIVSEPIRATASPVIFTFGGILKKRGWLEYTDPSSPPRIYLREQRTGNFPGCPATGLPARDYQFEHWLYEDNGPWFLIPQPAAYYASNGNYWDGPPVTYPFPASSPGEDVPLAIEDGYKVANQKTKRTYTRTIQCGENQIEDKAELELSEEYTTQMLNAVVDAYADQSAAPPDFSGFQYPPFSTLFNCALHYQSADETCYGKQRLFFRLDCEIPYAFAEEQSFSFKYRKITTDLDTGEQSTPETVSVSVSFPAGSKSEQTDWIEIAPTGDNKLIRLEVRPEDQPTHSRFFHTLADWQWAAHAADWTRQPSFLPGTN